MRPLALALALCLLAQTARAAPTVEELRGRYRSARVQRNIGWSLAAVGVALLASGGVLVGVGATANQSFEQGVADVVAGIASLLIGLALAAPGAVLALRGQEVMTDLRWRLDAAAPPGGSAPRALLGLRFRF